MDEIISQNSINNLYLVFVAGTVLIIAWIFETIWREDKKWVPYIAILPLSMIIFIFKNWEETKAKCFFLTLLMVMILLIGGVINYNFLAPLSEIMWKAAVWPYYLGRFILARYGIVVTL